MSCELDECPICFEEFSERGAVSTNCCQQKVHQCCLYACGEECPFCRGIHGHPHTATPLHKENIDDANSFEAGYEDGLSEEESNIAWIQSQLDAIYLRILPYHTMNIWFRNPDILAPNRLTFNMSTTINVSSLLPLNVDPSLLQMIIDYPQQGHLEDI